MDAPELPYMWLLCLLVFILPSRPSRIFLYISLAVLAALGSMTLDTIGSCMQYLRTSRECYVLISSKYAHLLLTFRRRRSTNTNATPYSKMQGAGFCW